MERCPNCRARGGGDTTCRRCGMDLAMLIEVEEAADRLTALGVAQLAAGDPAAAKRNLTGALGLRRTRLAELVLGFAEALEEQRGPNLGVGPVSTKPP